MIWFMSFNSSILWLVMMEDQVHFRMSSLREIAAATSNIQAMTTTCELSDDMSCVIDVV
jgi:hypothetical protein